MLVRMLSTNGGISKYMDENQLLEMPEARKERATMWKEYLVVWKTSYIELYEPHVSGHSVLFNETQCHTGSINKRMDDQSATLDVQDTPLTDKDHRFHILQRGHVFLCDMSEVKRSFSPTYTPL